MYRSLRRKAAEAAFAAAFLPFLTAVPSFGANVTDITTIAPGTWNSNQPLLNPAVATPQSVLGWTPGDDYKLDSWDQLTKVYERLAETSNRVLVQKVGKTTEGHDYLVVIISSPANLKNLKKLQQINLELTDPRKIKGGDAEAEDLIKQGKAVVALTYGVHSTETASYLGGQDVAYDLASHNDPETLRILDNEIIVLVPARNPDGVDIVKDSYDKRLAATANDGTGGSGRGFGGGGGGVLINKYIGHDDNRDYVGATQRETKLELQYVHNAWHPQIVHDVHQQGQDGPRLTLPPYTAPVEPNIPKTTVQEYNDLGFAIAKDLFNEGFKGVQNGGSAGGEGYDDWSPLRHYVHFHNAVRILEESASVDIASPVEIAPSGDQEPTPNVLAPWPGGKWTIGDGVSLVQATTYSVLDHAATEREYFLKTAYENAKEAVRPRTAGEKAAYLIPDAPNRNVLLSTLYKGGVEVSFLKEDLHEGDTIYPKGTAVVRLDQPYGGYANALLSKQDYPNLRDADGNPIRPYDVTAHTISLLYDVPSIAVDAPFTAVATAPQPIPETPAKVVKDLAVPSTVRLALLKSNSQEQGWVRFVFDLNGVKYTEIDNTEIAAGNLHAKYDAIVFPTGIGGGGRGGGGGFGGRVRQPQGAPQDATTTAEAVPTNAQTPTAGAGPGAGFGGGGRALSADGEAALKDFVNQGGSVIALNQASDAFITLFNLPVQDVTQGLGRTDFFSPGEILETDVDTTSRLAKGIGQHSIVWAQNSPAFQVTDAAQPGQVSVVAKYPSATTPLLSGWLLGGEQIEGKDALLDVKQGQGHVILFGFVPHYRGLALATYPFLFNAITDAAGTNTAEKDSVIAHK